MSDQCRECGRELGAGYLCDECDGVALASPVTKRDALFWLAVAVATGLYGPARGTALSRTFSPNDGTAIGATLAAGSIGSAVLPLLAGSLIETYSWRLIVGGLGVPVKRSV